MGVRSRLTGILRRSKNSTNRRKGALYDVSFAYTFQLDAFHSTWPWVLDTFVLYSFECVFLIIFLFWKDTFCNRLESIFFKKSNLLSSPNLSNTRSYSVNLFETDLWKLTLSQGWFKRFDAAYSENIYGLPQAKQSFFILLNKNLRIFKRNYHFSWNFA